MTKNNNQQTTTTNNTNNTTISISSAAARGGKLYKTLYGARMAAKAAALAPYDNVVVVRKAHCRRKFIGWGLDTNCPWLPSSEGFLDFFWGYRKWKI